ncbi:MAG: hypothetical protein P4L56_16090 [Candidatus Sulfopaludibacter sp.]|nr:hypothetical protein [Candidatus Sulfopaludibacter sp.]
MTNAPQPSAGETTHDRYSDPTPRSRDANDVARFLAGLPGTEGSPFVELEKTEAWKLHRGELDHAWDVIEKSTMPAMRQFQASELSAPSIEKSVAFYPFSGPDALMLTVFFPKNPTYVMVALEPAGTLPSLKQLSRGDLNTKLAAVRSTVSSELHKSFFVTREMDRQFRGQVTDGLFAPIANLLVRTGHTILGYKYVRFNEKGEIVDRGPEVSTKASDKGVEIDFSTDADHSVHKLLYFSVNLANDHMEKNPAFLAYLASLRDVSTYFKATSYMTHQDLFSMIRNGVLEHSQTILQDDSGIPYKFFAGGGWHVTLFGGYSRPYGSFRWLEQPDLRKAYDTDARPLAFRIGYGFSKAPSNLLLATKSAAPPTGKAEQR